jgi:hypothetical protein
MSNVTKKELNAYKKKHMKFHREEAKKDKREDKKMIKVAIRKARLRKCQRAKR